MFHRLSTWWRALSIVPLSLATVTWPSAAQAAATPTFSVVHQDAVAALSKSGTARFNVTLLLSSPDRRAVARISLYPRIVMRSQIAPVIGGQGLSSHWLATTDTFSMNCIASGPVTFSIELYTTRPGHLASHCGARLPLLHLPCANAACSGVYPISYSVTSRGTVVTKWSLLAVKANPVEHPLHLVFISTLGPLSWQRATRTEATLSIIAEHARTPVTLTADYRTLAQAQADVSTSGTRWRDALTRALTSPLHQVISAPPNNIDYAGLVANGFNNQLSRQLVLSGQLLRSVSGRYVDSPVLLDGHTSTASLAALAGAGVSDVVLPETQLTVAPSSTLTWGAPFHPAGANSINALSVDQPLSSLALNSSIEPGRRAAITLGSLAFLYFEAPSAAAIRTVVMIDPAPDLSTKYLGSLLSGLSRNPYVGASSLTPSFDSTLVGANGSPTVRSLVSVPPSRWIARNVSTLTTLVSAIASYIDAVSSPRETFALRVALAQSEITGDSTNRQNALNAANATLSSQLNQFSVDPSAITLAGPGTALPITLLSRADYTVTAVVHLITDRLSFPKSKNVVVTLSSPTQSIRVPTSRHEGSSLTLQVQVTTPDGRLVLARAAIQVRITGVSVVGYLLTIASILVLALWWWRTYRRRAKGRHAR